jgi:hypothetical protein
MTCSSSLIVCTLMSRSRSRLESSLWSRSVRHAVSPRCQHSLYLRGFQSVALRDISESDS